jgi:hypothetical protein
MNERLTTIDNMGFMRPSEILTMIQKLTPQEKKSYKHLLIELNERSIENNKCKFLDDSAQYMLKKNNNIVAYSKCNKSFKAKLEYFILKNFSEDISLNLMNFFHLSFNKGNIKRGILNEIKRHMLFFNKDVEINLLIGDLTKSRKLESFVNSVKNEFNVIEFSKENLISKVQTLNREINSGKVNANK